MLLLGLFMIVSIIVKEEEVEVMTYGNKSLEHRKEREWGPYIRQFDLFIGHIISIKLYKKTR